jgi:hypothetical protein
MEWNAAEAQWFCIKCLIASDHVIKEDAQIELDHFECVSPKTSPKIEEKNRTRRRGIFPKRSGSGMAMFITDSG